MDNFVRERAPNHGTTNEEPLCGRHCPCVVRQSVCLPYFVSRIHTGFKLFTKSNEIVPTHLGYRDTEHFRSSIILQKPNCLLCPLCVSNGCAVLNVPTSYKILDLYYDLNGVTLKWCKNKNPVCLWEKMVLQVLHWHLVTLRPLVRRSL